ncbi:MAG: DUF420 domain-containing protein [Actinobacteria bacterium]|nr:DUF420 domain-containing protein [Actinomycetota bacterium]
MIAFLDGTGFITSRSSMGADLSLLISIAAFVMLTVGVVLAKSKRYEAHRWVQTVAVVLNAVPVVIWMIRSFRLSILPDLPGNLGKSVEALTTVHAVAGLIGVVLGMFVIVRANQLEAKGQSLSRYKNLMRVASVAYLLATALGVWVYIAIYGWPRPTPCRLPTPRRR